LRIEKKRQQEGTQMTLEKEVDETV